MSIIHDALKKVQRGLNAKNNRKSTIAPAAPAAVSDYIYAKPAQDEELSETAIETIPSANPFKRVFRSILIIAISVLVSGGSLFFLYQQYNNYLPKNSSTISRSSYGAAHQNTAVVSRPKASSADLKPMAQITIPPAESDSTAASQAAAPVTLNIHGVMANGSSVLVLINDQVYQEGDTVDGARILKINLNSITVDINGNEQTIPVKN